MSNAISIKKNNAIESVRFIAALAIVFLHYCYLNGFAHDFVNQTTRFAVPFFFTVSGYFLAQKLKSNDVNSVYLKQLKKITILYLGWQIIYFMYPNDVDFNTFGAIDAYKMKFQNLIGSSIEYIFFDGFSFHLWFLFSLMLTIILFMMVKTKHIKALLILSVILYVFGVLVRAYGQTPIGIPHEFNPRNYVFFSCLPFFLGAYMSLKSIKLSLLNAYLLAIVGFAIHYIEAYFLKTYYQTELLDFGFSTFLMGIGIFQLTLHEPKFLSYPRLANLGKLAFGIYCSHVLIALILIQYFRFDVSTDLNKLLFPIIIFIFSIVFVLILKKIKYLNQLV